MNDWLAWFISLIRETIRFLSQLYVFDVSLIALFCAFTLLGVTLRAFLYKA